MEPSVSRSVAVIGSGVAGLTAAYVLSGRDRVTLYEADVRLGGHAHTHFVDDDGQTLGVDSAFLVHNDRTYPTLCRLFSELGVATQESEMSMSVRADDIGLEYAGALGVRGLFACRRSLRPRYLLMLGEIVRFHRAADRLLRADPAQDDLETLDAFLSRHHFSSYFIDYFITPLVAAVWSCAADNALRYPARYLFTFLAHHGMLSVFGSPTWRTVTGGSAHYVQAIATRLDEVSIGTPVHSLRRVSGRVRVQAGSNAPRFFDAAVVAVHPDQALLLLDDPTPWERAVLGAIPYSTNRAQLHTDESVLPRRRRASASWNYLVTPGTDQVVVSYDVSRLMRLDTNRRYLVTLGGRDRVDPASVIAEMTYSHPLYTPESVAAQANLTSLNDDRVVFAGAYHGWGFHEDGAASGLAAARRLGVDWPTATRRKAAVGCPATR